MLAAPGDDQVTGPGVDPQRDLIAHHPRRHEDGRVLADQTGELRFEGIDRGVLTEAVIADHGLGDRLSHGRGGLGHGVADQIHVSRHR